MRKRKEEEFLIGNNGNNNTENKNEEVIKELENIESEYKEQKEEKKRKRRTKAEKEKERVEEAREFASNLSSLSNLLLNALIIRLPRQIPLSDFEREAFNESFANLIIKYYSRVERWSTELAFLLAISLIVLPRLKKDENNIDIRKNGDGEDNISEESN